MYDDTAPVSEQLTKSLIGQLKASANPRGGWGYRVDTAPAAEPTALACLALGTHRVSRALTDAGLARLVEMQLTDGRVAVSSQTPSASWPTGLAALAWLKTSDAEQTRYRTNARKAIEWLLSTHGTAFRTDPNVYGHNTTLIGWPWVDGTHTWIEPTAYALMALRAAEQQEHTRYREAVALIHDRMIDGGGWNYGNRRVFAALLRPFPAPTGIVLTALAGERRDAHIESSIDYLATELRGVTSAVSLAWGLIGLAAWHDRPKEADAWLLRSAARRSQDSPSPLENALLLLAASGDGDLSPFSPPRNQRTSLTGRTHE